MFTKLKSFFVVSVFALMTALATVSVVLPIPAVAAEKTASIYMTANVQSQCRVDNSFLLYNLEGTVGSATFPFTPQVLCNAGTAFVVGMDNGLNRGLDPTDSTARVAVATDGTGGMLKYYLWQDSAQTIPWETVTQNGYSAVGTGTWQDLPGVIEFRDISYSRTGDYTDTITVTVSYDGFV